MTPAHANDNTPRPAWFDQLLLKYDPFIRKKCTGDEDLYQDVRLRMLERWHQFRKDGSFVAWAGYMVRGARGESARRSVRRSAKAHLQRVDTCVQPSQEHYTDINLVLESLTTVESVSLRCSAMGYEYHEIGKMRGVSKQAAAQAAKLGRARLAANDNRPAEKQRLRA